MQESEALDPVVDDHQRLLQFMIRRYNEGERALKSSTGYVER